MIFEGGNMIENVRKYTCDACGKSVDMNEGDNIPKWTEKTDVGDLCPSCANAWETWKKDFITRMRVENHKPVVDIPKVKKED